LSQGLAALAISALGLAVAGSMSLTTNAQTTAAEPPAVSTTQTTKAANTAVTATSGTVVGVAQTTKNAQTTKDAPATPAAQSPAAQSPAAQAFTARDSGIDTSRSEQLRAALAKERAAQRAEDLAQIAEQVTRADRDQASKARKTTLDATERKIQENAVKLAWARQQRAIAARVAARIAARNAAAAASTTDPATSGTDPDLSTIPTGGTAVAPVPGAVVGAHFGQYGLWSRYHTGLDFRAGFGTPIRAVLSGVVVYAGNSGDWAGNHVAIRHAGGVTTMSSHMSTMAVRPGQTVSAGQVIGYVGSTGRAFGPHLHFELYPAGVRYGDVYRAIDPQSWLRSHGLQTR
jgi:murein DD-endopeptidase MepM/ murein hydrolase activator NlpD